MMNSVFQKVAVVCFALCVLWSAGISQAAEEWHASRTWIAGTDCTVWVIGAEDASGEAALPTLQMWQASVLKDKPISPKQTRFLPAIVGSPLVFGADPDALRVMFNDLSTWSYYADRDGAPWMNWRDVSNEPPLAWAGDAAEPAVWALARTPVLLPEKPATADAKPAIASQPVDSERLSEADSPATNEGGQAPQSSGAEAGSTTSPSVKTPSSGLTLLHYRNSAWHRIQVLDQAEDGLAFWLAARMGEAYLFWREPSQAVFCASWSSSGAWSAAVPVNVEGDLRAAWAGACELGPVFVAGVEDVAAGGRERVQIQLYCREAGGWSAPRRVSEGPEYLVLDPATACVGIAANRVIVSRSAADGTVEFGMADLGLSPSVRFTTLQIRQELSGSEMTWLEMISLVLMLALMTLIFMSRREQMARLAIPPKGFVVASIWRRILATFIDAIPAFAVASPVWMAVYGRDVFATLQRLGAGANPEPADLICVQVLWLIAVFFYGVWCCAWELSIRTTPGKLVFGCRVAGMFGQRPTTKQILARNAMRIMVFALGEPGLIVTLMTMVLVSRNRQRLGDILADTVVIEPAPPAEDMQNYNGPPS